MIFIALIAYALISVFITAILCAIIGSFNIIKDEKDQKVVFVLLIIGGSTDGAMPHMFKA